MPGFYSGEKGILLRAKGTFAPTCLVVCIYIYYCTRAKEPNVQNIPYILFYPIPHFFHKKQSFAKKYQK